MARCLPNYVVGCVAVWLSGCLAVLSGCLAFWHVAPLTAKHCGYNCMAGCVAWQLSEVFKSTSMVVSLCVVALRVILVHVDGEQKCKLFKCLCIV